MNIFFHASLFNILHLKSCCGKFGQNLTCCFFNVLFGDLNPQKSFFIHCWRLFSVWPLWRSQFPIHTSLQEQAFHQHLNDSLWRTKAHPLQSVKKNVKVVEIQHHKFVFLQNYGHKTLFWQIWHEIIQSKCIFLWLPAVF